MNWRDATLIGFDTETSGSYPLAAEICEIAAVKWRGGQVIDRFQSLVAVKRPIPANVIAIHNITNEMLVDAPKLDQVIRDFYAFIGDAYLVAHHAPFDLGFVAPAIENLKLPLPKNHVFCSSLMSRKAFPESINHKLQTLIQFFKLPQGQAHRALDDAEACLSVGIKVFEKLEKQMGDLTIEKALKYQAAVLDWQSYSVMQLRSHTVYGRLVEALEQQIPVQIVYSGGSRPGQARTVHALGLVRNPLDDYLVAREEGVQPDEVPKRYFLNKITAARL
jgi:DNA polymerase-3 subunit epsilon